MATVAVMNRWSPRMALAECEAKRQIIDAYRVEHAKAFRHPKPYIDTPAGGALAWALKALALLYADHEGYREEWRP